MKQLFSSLLFSPFCGAPLQQFRCRGAFGFHMKGCHGIPVPDYTDENASDKVVRIIQSYTGIVNRTVWRKDG